MFKIKARILTKALSFSQSLCQEIICSIFETFIVKMAFLTNVVDLQAALSACVTVRDWEMLTEAVLIPDEWMTMAYARLTELTVQELEVS